MSAIREVMGLPPLPPYRNVSNDLTQVFSEFGVLDVLPSKRNLGERHAGG
jgi:hypothetical protein